MTRTLARVSAVALTIGTLLVSGCGAPAATPTATKAPPTATVAKAPAASPSITETLGLARGAEYLTDMTASGKARLDGGKFEQSVVPGSASKTTITLLNAPVGTGDLNGDGTEDAAVILAANSGGSGTFISLHALFIEKGVAKDAAWVTLGDRVQVKAVTVKGGIITVDMVKHAANDPLCCPTQAATTKYKLQEGKLVVVP